MFRRSITLLAAIAPARALRVPIPSNALSRRAFAGTALSTALAGVAVAPSPAFAASDGKWAQRYDEFTDADFEDFKTAPSGLKYKIIEEGYGVKPLAGQKIKAHYSGYLLNGAKFDSSYDRGSPATFAPNQYGTWSRPIATGHHVFRQHALTRSRFFSPRARAPG